MAAEQTIPASARPPDRAGGASFVSVVIRSYTTHDEVLRLIAGLACQTRLPDEFVVIDSGSAVPIADALRRLAREGVAAGAGRVPLRLIEISNSAFSSAGSLNQAIAEARGDLIAVISQDALPADGYYLERLVSAFDSAAVAGAYGRQILSDDYDPLGEKDLEKTYPPESRTQGKGECWFVNTCSMLRRGLWERHPFEPKARVSEDHEWGKWATDNGFAIRYVGDAVVRHYHPFRRLGELWGRYYAEGRGMAWLHGRGFPLGRALFCYVRETASDGVWLFRRGMPWHWPRSWVRRLVKYAALWKGHRDEMNERGAGR